MIPNFTNENINSCKYQFILVGKEQAYIFLLLKFKFIQKTSFDIQMLKKKLEAITKGQIYAF